MIRENQTPTSTGASLMDEPLYRQGENGLILTISFVTGNSSLLLLVLLLWLLLLSCCCNGSYSCSCSGLILTTSYVSLQVVLMLITDADML